MRDPNRIDETIEIIRQLWHQYPDMRLGQLLLNTDMDYNTEDHMLAYKLGLCYGFKESK